MKQPSEEKAEAQRRKLVSKTALALALMVVGVGAIYLAGRGVRAYLLSRPRAGRDAVIHPGPTTRSLSVPQGPVEAATAPLAAVGLVRLRGDPAGIAPPAGARRLFAYQRRRSEETEQQGRYEFDGPADEAAGHYTAALAKKGFTLVRDGVGPLGRRMLIFDGRGGYAAVAFRTNPPKDRTVIIVLTVVQPTTTKAPDKR